MAILNKVARVPRSVTLGPHAGKYASGIPGQVYERLYMAQYERRVKAPTIVRGYRGRRQIVKPLPIRAWPTT